MQKFITFMRLTDKGQMTPPEKVADVYKHMLAITESFGGKTLEIWTAQGKYDFVSISEFPSTEAAFKSLVKLNQLGVARLESAPTFPIEAYLAVATEKREPVLV